MAQMAMPWQLKEGLRRRIKGRPPRPIVEQLPSIAVHKLPIPSPNDRKTYILRDISLRIPQLAAAKVAHNAVEFHLPSLHRSTIGPIQTFGLKHIRTGFGKNSFGGVRHAFICHCGRPVIKLYVLNRWIACQRCHNAIHASQAVNQQQRPVLQASRIASFLDNKSKLYRRTRERLRKRLGDKVMMAQGQLGTWARPLWE
jgi:hypothetical protein